MKSSEFNKQFEVDTNRKRGIVATRKGVGIPTPKKVNMWTTANGKGYNPQSIYYFFDVDGLKKQVRTNIGLSLNEEKGHLDSLGYRVVAVSRLRDSESEAFDDGIEYNRKIIKDAEKEIAKIENQKS